MRLLYIILLLMADVAANAAPPPKETDSAKIKRLFGEPIDPNNDCKFTLEDNKLKISIPASKHPLNFHGIARDGTESTAPRIQLESSGDFTIEVKILNSYPTGPGNSAASCGAGFYFTSGLKSSYYIGRWHSFNVNGEVTSSSLRYYGRKPNSGTSSNRNVTDEEAKQPVYLKVEKEGSKLSSFNSKDGKDWKPFGAYLSDMTDPIKFGIYAEQSGEREYSVVFDEFKLTKKEPK